MTLPKTMRAVVLTGRGGFDRLEWHEDVPVPEPGPTEVLIRVAAAGVNNTDINTRIGWYAPDSAQDLIDGDALIPSMRDDVGWSGDVPTYPRIQGADACGRIVAVGPGVDSERIGERVIVEPSFRDEENPSAGPIYFGSEVNGAFAEYTIAPSRHAWAVDSGWTDVELASIPCSYSAAENMIGRAGVTPGDTVVVTGASGGVGSAAVQLAKRRGATVIALAAPDKHDAVIQLGADHVLPRDAHLERRSIDVIIDAVGGPAWPGFIDALHSHGRLATCGAIGGHRVELDLRTLYLNDLTLFGCTVLDRGVFADLVRYIEHDEIHPVVAATFPLREIAAAQRTFLSKRHVGKIVLTVS
jgi:NADPH:quinone reductase-like Zn-dependent oxidoreductase